ncbi:MAG: hypothetical protein IJ727_07485 [Treponema sp.]|nr:hypothetical protein [Treponema sp.]
MKKYLLFAVSAFAFTFMSCVSMQEDVYIDSFSENSAVTVFEKRFSYLDAAFYDESQKNKQSQKDAEELIGDIEEALKDVSIKKAVEARMNAIAGCVAYDVGNKSLAKKFLESSVEAYKGDVRSLILASRLGIEKDLIAVSEAVSDKSLINLELAIVNYSKGNYVLAVAKFDEAFLSLDAFYREAYGILRNKSWKLRNVADSQSSISDILSLDSITVMQMIVLTNQNPDLLFNYTSGKAVSEKELFNKIAGSGLLNPVSKPLDESSALTRSSIVTRLVAARFLWNLYNHRQNTTQLATKYSESYKNKKRSPILDVKLDSPDFDAVLGCVENEIMHLEDGIEFGAEKEISGSEFDESVKKIK